MHQKNTSIVVILNIVIMVIIVTLLSAAGMVSYSLLSNKERSRLKELNIVLAEQASTGLAMPVSNIDKSSIVMTAESVMKEKSSHAVVVRLASTGMIIKALVRNANGYPVITDRKIDADGLMSQEKDIVYANEVIGNVRVFVTPVFLEEQLASMRIAIISFIAVISIVLTVVQYLLLWRIILKPITMLEEYAQGLHGHYIDDSLIRSVTFHGELESLRTSVIEMVTLLDARYAELLQKTKRYSESEERFRTLVNTIPDLIWLKDERGVYLSCNRMFERLFGVPEAKIVGKSDYDFVARQQADLLRENDLKAMSAGKLSSNEEWLTFAEDDSQVFLYTTKTPMYDTDGHLIGVLGIGRDITERKQAEEELKRHREHLEILVEERTAELGKAVAAADSANMAKSMFLANMSHEIRTPMNAVFGFAQLLQRDRSLSPVSLNKVSAILKSGEHLLSIINDILEMSLIEAGRVELRCETLDLHALLGDLSIMFRMRAEEKHLLFTLESAADLSLYITADIGKLRQILINLLGNAVKFTKSGSVSLRAFPAGIDRITIEVTDTGIGIAEVELEKLFHPFERTKSGEQEAGGTGLGLAISREYAHLMGGEITVDSAPDRGSCFRLEFHAPTTSDVPLSSEHNGRRVIGLAPDQGEIRALLVDDLSTNRELLRGILEPLGFLVDEASDGKEAVEKTIFWEPQVILMDLVMPGMDGSEALRVLRTTHPIGSLVIIGITASVLEQERRAFIESGINAYIVRPFREQELFDVLSDHAGIVFESEDVNDVPEIWASHERPSIDGMTAVWRGEFRLALSRKNITRIRKLAEEARVSDPLLSDWLKERAERYNLDELMELVKNEQ